MSDEITGRITENGMYQKTVKGELDQMTADINTAKQDPDQKGEPETRVKQIIYRSIATKFKNVLRET